ncbi:acyl-CoA thioesterase [Salinibacillus xinjiangensis]|uniref:Acyl-CoA thioesterase n=1 Tax=Salinibacillus xinjiangensis TaxID=1229268 RepID=A0A6G1X719_9BACI|nr:thioesterase family protein [Salinibacillus xinjiangensis]MRG86801.1 acyl-CoA thioesterase [Salinibacillus xinjiangensis]
MRNECTVRVRASETDALGHVNNVSYFIYYEEARIELFRELVPTITLEDWPFILAYTSSSFKQQGYFDEKLTIQTFVRRIGNKSFELQHEILNERGVISIGNETVVYFDFNTQKAAPIPDDIRLKLESYLETNEIKEG